jgi:hypothetical protein
MISKLVLSCTAAGNMHGSIMFASQGFVACNHACCLTLGKYGHHHQRSQTATAVHPAMDMETTSGTTELASPPNSDKQTAIQIIHWLNNRQCTGPYNACLEICLKGCVPVRVEECGHRWTTIAS